MLSSQAPRPSPSHRRQNSTPIIGYMPAKASYNPAQIQNQRYMHRRGLSIDLAMQPLGTDLTLKQDNGKVSTNQGTHLQQNMRETQMPASSRPGLDEYFRGFGTAFEQEFLEHKELGVLDPELASLGQTIQQMDSKNHGSLVDLADPFAIPEDSTTIVKEPLTPRKQLVSGHFPMTPVTETRGKFQVLPQSLQSSPIRRCHVETVKLPHSVAMKRGGSCQDSFAMTRQLSDGIPVPSPPGTAPIRSSATFDVAPIPNTPVLDVLQLNMDFAANVDYSSSNYSPITNHGSPSMSSFQSSPDLPPANLFGELADLPPNFSALAQHSGAVAIMGDDTTPKRKIGSPKKSSLKINSDSESTFNPMDYMHNDTGITEEEINAHISGPDQDGKYTCLHEDCTSKQPTARKDNVFGRKENIRAHVQTHLEDRRFECDVCYKRFVRPNDLKRHWNIHLNKRDFKCVCNAAFNRHDALKRHRERSEYCESGGKRGIPGSPKKEEKKRGRPKKIAPTETEERRERKAFIRRQVLKKKQASVASSVASSQPSPPADFDVPDLQRAQPSINGYSPVTATFTPPASPGNTANNIFSPMQSQSFCTPKANSMSPPPTRGSITASLGLSTKSVADNDFAMDFLTEPMPAVASSPPKSSASQYGTPPELDLSSSSPSAPLADFSFTDSLNQSSITPEDADFLDDMVTKSTNESFDTMFSFIGGDITQEVATKSDDMELFRDTLTDDFYWAHT